MPRVTKTELTAAQKGRLVEKLMQGLCLCSDENDLYQWRKETESTVIELNDQEWTRYIEEAVIERKCLITQKQMENNYA